jgi:hypothetical protein
MSDLESLRLDGLHERHPGLTQALGQSYAEAASVCLSRHHQPPVILSLKHAGNDQLRVVNFVVPDERVSNAHANEIDATEAGAYPVCEKWLKDRKGRTLSNDDIAHYQGFGEKRNRKYT